MVGIRQIDWCAIDHTINILAFRIGASHIKFDGIYGIPRGGLVPAVMLSHELKIPMVFNIDAIDDRKILVVDDIADTGATINKFFAEKVVCTATLFYRVTSEIKPEFYGVKTESLDWFVFPWERHDTIKS